MSQAMDPHQQIMQGLMGKCVAAAIKSAAAFNLADHIESGVTQVSQLAEEAGTDPSALFRLLRALTAVGIFTQVDKETFRNNEASRLLSDAHPASLKSMALWLGDDTGWRSWGHLDYSIKTGKPAFDHVFDMPVFDYFREHPETGQIFNHAMSGFSQVTGEAVAKAYDFSRFQHVVDVGGGHGKLLELCLRDHPDVKGTVFDLPEVVASFPQHSKLEALGGNFFEGVPVGADAYIMKHIIHDWDDEACIRILNHCRQAMREDGRVLIVDILLTEAEAAAFGKFLDLEMLLLTQGGKERDRAQFESLFRRAGLELSGIYPTESLVSILEARIP